MGFEIKNTPSASAPNIEEGLTPAVLVGLSQVLHEEWAGPGKFGYDNGDRIHWLFNLVDGNEDTLYDDSGDPVEVEAINSATLNTKSDKSKNAAWLKAVSPAAFAAVDAGTGFSAEDLVGAPCFLLIETKENGWPKVVNVIPRKLAKKAKAAPAATIDED